MPGFLTDVSARYHKWRLLRNLKATSAHFTTLTDASSAEWLQRNGYQRLARNYGYGAMSPEAALQIGAFYAGVKVIAEDEGSQPFFLYQCPPGSRDIRKAEEKRLFEVLHKLPNPEMSSGTFVETLTAHAVVCGTGYAKIVRNSDNEVIQLWPIQPNEIRADKNRYGRKYYHVYDPSKRVWTPTEQDQIFDLPGFSWSGFEGNEVLELARRSLGLTDAQERYAADYFSNDRTPGVVLEHPGQLDPETIVAIKEAWKRMIQAHDVAVTQEGMKVNVTAKTNVESQLNESRRFQVLEVCRWLRLSPHKLADLERMTFSNVEQMQIDHKNNVLLPWNGRWSESVYRCLLTPEEREQGYYAEHSMEVFLRGDFKTQADGWRTLLDKGVLTINEVRAFLNMNPLDGGDAAMIQLNMQRVVDAANGATAELPN